MMTEGPMPARTSATKEVEEVLEADPTVTGYALTSVSTKLLLIVSMTDSSMQFLTKSPHSPSTQPLSYFQSLDVIGK